MLSRLVAASSFGLATTLASATLQSAAPNGSAQTLTAVAEAYHKAMLEDSLFLRMKAGLEIERLPDLTLPKAETDSLRATALLRRLREVKAEELDHEQTLSLEILRYKLRADSEAARHYGMSFPVTPYASPIGAVHAMLAAHGFKDKPAAERYLALVAQYPAFLGQIRNILEGQARRGMYIPLEEMDVVLGYVGAAGDPKGPLAVSDERLTLLAPAARAAFRERMRELFEGNVAPAVRELTGYLGGDYRKRSPATVGLSQYTGGREYYVWLVRQHTTLDIHPEAVHRIGIAEVERIEAEMAKVREALGFKGSKAEFKAALTSNPRLYPKTAEQIGETLLRHVRAIEPKIDAYFLRRPRAPYGVKRLDPQDEPGMTFGRYEPPTADAAVGLYRFNGSKLEDRSLLNAAALAFHELLPGHHFQICLSFENTAIPPFRRDSFEGAFSEGWGAYSADLADEMGLYKDPYDRYGYLSMDMFISVRLVVDTGMNALGWSREKAVAYMREHALETDTQIRSETLRYSVDIPAQALAYKMGSRRIHELRARAKAALGAQFDLRRFHDVLIGSGSMPLATLDKHVTRFVERERGGQQQR